jgi:molybdenum cofactor cytidylyltransferase
MKIATLILAAGSSTRFGSPKQLAPFQGTTLLGHVIKQTSTWPAAETWVVLGANAEEILEGVEFGDAKVVINEDFEEGIASSLRAGLDALLTSSKIDAAFIVMGDQPSIPEAVPEALADAMEFGGHWVVVPQYRFERSNPVLVGRQLWERFMSLSGDEGAMKLLRSHPEWVHQIRFEELPPRDIDTQSDYEQHLPRSKR